MISTSVSIAFASTLFLMTLIYHIFCALKESKFFKAIKQKARKSNFDDFSYRDIPETELKESVYAGTPTSTEVSLTNTQDGGFASADSNNSRQKSFKAKEVIYPNRLRESLLQD